MIQSAAESNQRSSPHRHNSRVPLSEIIVMCLHNNGTSFDDAFGENFKTANMKCNRSNRSKTGEVPDDFPARSGAFIKILMYFYFISEPTAISTKLD